jgi:hypothetical protein
MRVYVTIPNTLLPALQDQARAAHRPPRYHLEWLIRQALQERHADEKRCPLVQQSSQQEEPCAVE